MATLSLKISIDGGTVVKTIQLEPSTTVLDACRIIREKILEAVSGDPKDYGLFLASEEDNKKGIWLEPSRSLDYYMLRNGDMLEYARKTRNLRVRMLDGTVKTLLVDDSQIVANLMVVICTKIGITNHDEYGLVREESKEEPDPCDKPNYGTLTLRRKHHDKERDAKMDQLRKKLRTDDEVNWVEGSKTLREQGIDCKETLLLQRKLFYSDRNVDSRDPLQLTLLYAQAQKAILENAHPVTVDKACEFAGIQCQIQFGDHKEDKHTAGFLDLKEFLPSSYMKIKAIEKKVFKEHKKHVGLSELDAKVLYIKTARDMPTYGVAFFLVKEKMKGKNKLVPRLLGVSKDSILRLDEKTKEIIQTWPLTTVRRWCASPNTFTLDFGDYSDQYYSVQTTEAEQILQVIAGYIDIIVKRQRVKDHLGIEGDEGSAMLEDSVSPSKANIIQHDTFKSGKVNTESVAKPAVMRPGAEGAKSFALGHLTGAQQTTISGQIVTGHTPPAASQAQQTKVTAILSEPQRALLSTITTGREIIQRTETELNRAQLPDLGTDASSIKWKQTTLTAHKQTVTSHIAAMNAATAQVVTLTAGATEEVDHSAVGAAITTITSNLPEMTKEVQMIAALMDDNDNGDRLLDATRKLCTAFSDLLKAAEPETKEPRQSLLNAASRVGEASTSVLYTIGEETPQDKESQDILLSLAKAVANTTAALVLKAKHVAAQCKDEQHIQSNIISCATNAALATSQLVACAKVVAPTLQNPACREQLTSAARLVGQAVERLVDACKPVQDKEAVDSLMVAAGRVAEELRRLLDRCQLDRCTASVSEQAVDSVLVASERLVATHDAPEMLRQARVLGQATAHLIAAIKTEADAQPSESQRKLLAAAKLLADATARMLEAARQCTSSPQDRDKQEALRQAAEELRFITTDYGNTRDVVASQMARLQETAKNTAACATQFITSAHAASQYNTNHYTQEALDNECSRLSESISEGVWSAPPSNTNLLHLISHSSSQIQTCSNAVQASRTALPTVSDVAAAKQLSDATHRLATSYSQLRSVVNRVRVTTQGTELEAAIEIIRSLQSEMEEVASQPELTPLPNQTAQWATSTLSTSARSISSSTAGAALSARARDEPGAAAHCAAGALALRPLCAAARAAASTLEAPGVVRNCQEVLNTSLTLVETVKRYFSENEPTQLPTIVTLANELNENLDRTLEAVPSHAELDAALQDMSEILEIIDSGEFPPVTKSYGELQSELTESATELNQAAGALVSSLRPRDVSHFSDAHSQLCHTAIHLSSASTEVETRTRMMSSLKTVTINSSKLLSTVKSVSQDANRPNAKNQLTAAARSLTDSISRLIDTCTSAAPGQKECASAIMRIESCAPWLRDPAQPLSEMPYHACLDAIVDHSKLLSEGMSGMASAAKRSNYPQLCAAVSSVADAICGLVETAAHVAYLIGVSHEDSTAGRPGVVEQGQLARCAEQIYAACRLLTDNEAQPHQIVSSATTIAKHTSSLCNSCRAASSKSTDSGDKRRFVQCAKHVAHCTAALVKRIKAHDASNTQESRDAIAEATVPLEDAVKALCQFADKPQFASVPARIPASARIQQQPILDTAKDIISSSCAMLTAGKALALAADDKQQWQALATHSKHVSDTIKALVTHSREKAPGQKECEAAQQLIIRHQRILDQAEMQADAGDLAPNKLNSLQGYCEQLENTCSEMGFALEPLRLAAVGEAENLGHSVRQLTSYIAPLVSASTGLASLSTPRPLLPRARTVLESSAYLLQSAAVAGGNHRATAAHNDVSSQMSLTQQALSELVETARELSTQRGAVQSLLDTVSRSQGELQKHRQSLISYDEADSFVAYQTRMVHSCKEIARIANDMMAGAATSPNTLVTLGSSLCSQYEKLVADCLPATNCMRDTNVAASLRSSVLELGDSVQSTISAGAACHQSGENTVAQHVNALQEQVAAVLSRLQEADGGAQACIDACAALQALISDLHTSTLFASAGTLHSVHEGDQFSHHRESILQSAKQLVEHTKALVAAACGTQAQLAAAAKAARAHVVRLCEVIKQGAASLGSSNPEPQVLVLNAARDVTVALRDLIAATAAAAGKPMAHDDMDKLKHAAKRLCDTKRWSLPAKTGHQPLRRRWSLTLRRNDYNSCDSETDIFQSDQEEELIKLLDYSSQDDDVSPSIYFDNCEETINYIEKLMKNPPKRTVNDILNVKYNVTSKNSVIDMDWRVLKYGENILLGEIKKLVDLVVDISGRTDNKRKIEVIKRLKAETDLDSEMKRISQVIDDMDADITKEDVNRKPKTPPVEKEAILTEKPIVEEPNIRSPVFKITKVRPVNLTMDLDAKAIVAEITPRVSPEKETVTINIKTTPVNVEPQKPVISEHKDEIKTQLTKTIVEQKAETPDVPKQFWQLFKEDTEWWQALAKRNLERMESTRRELQRFSNNELVLGEYQLALDAFNKEKQQLQGFIEEIDKSKIAQNDLHYNKKYEDVVLKLIDFAKKDFIFKGFDPIIDQLKHLADTEIPNRKKTVINIQDIINVYTQIDVSKYTYEELCILETHYKEMIKKYKKETKEKLKDKENIVPLRDARSASPSYHRSVILNVHSSQNTAKNIHQYTNTVSNKGGSLHRYKKTDNKTRNNYEIFDLTRTYPEEFYANNWWSIYEDILKNREEQFGSIDNWWSFYESILNKQPNDEQLSRLRSVVEYRNSLRKPSRPNSRMEEQLKMLDGIKYDRFQESEAVATSDRESVMVTNVTSLLKTVKAVEDEHTRGTRALESTIEAISQEVENLRSFSTSTVTNVTPEELIRKSRAMTMATAAAVSAGTSGKQDQLVAAANLGRNTVLDLLQAVKSCAPTAETPEIRDRLLDASSHLALTYKRTLSAVLAGQLSELPELSRAQAQALAAFVAAAPPMKGSDWVDPYDPTIIAESELLGAAASIDAAAKKLQSLRPRQNRHEADENLNFDEMILEAAKCIITATSALVRAASAAQRELIDQGKVARRPVMSSDDGQWSEGLISAARLVAAAAHSLVEASNALVQGAGSEERLISAARSVAATTAQLLVACKVKADPSSDSTRRLQSAGAEVIRSTDNLVRAARDAICCDDERSLVLNRRMVGGIAQEIDARSEVLRIEKELEEARGRLTAIRQAKYKLRTESGDETDTDVSQQAPALGFKSPTSSFVNTTYSPNSTYSAPNASMNTTNLSHNISQLNQSVVGSPGPIYGQNTSINQNTTNHGQNTTNHGQNTTNHGQNTSTYGHNTTNYTQNTSTYSQNVNQNTTDTNGYDKYSRKEEKHVQSPTFSSFRPQEDTPKQNYEGFTTRGKKSSNDRTMTNKTSMSEESVVVRSLQLPEVRKALLVTDGEAAERIFYKREKAPPPPPRRVSLLNYETRLYDTPKPVNEYTKTEETRQFESNQYSQFSKQEQKLGYDAPKLGSPLSPKFNARELKFDDKAEPLYSTLKKPTTPSTPKSPIDGFGQKFSEHKKSTEAIPGGTVQSEYSVKSESYQSYPKTEYSKSETRHEVKSPFATSTPAKYEFGKSTDLVKAATPDYDGISSPYGKETLGYGGPNFMEETTTEVKEIPNGTQKITTTKVYSSSPVNLTSTSTKYEPIKLEGLDELSKSFDNDSRYSTLDSRFNTLESKLSSDTSRSFMRPSEFQSSDYQTISNVTKVKKPSELAREIDNMDKKFSKQTITSETIERKSVMTSSHKSESSSTVTKKFGNF